MREDSVPLEQDPAYMPVSEDFAYDPDMPADLIFNQFPLETPGGVRAAWNYITNPDNADQHSHDEVIAFKERVKQSARQAGIDLHED
jgi:hypothetical protein